ncbi:MAG: agmatine deiminase [Chloroflexota bacterium]
MTLNTTPVQDGFLMPGEFEPHTRCWMMWPERPDVWRNQALPAQNAFVAVAEAIADFEPVTMVTVPSQADKARQRLSARIEVVPMPYNDAWMRDIGPTFVLDRAGGLRGVNWAFNAWGGLYEDWAADEQVAAQVLQMTGAKQYRTDFIMEGGAIHVDGQGTALVTAQCLLHPNRNPTLSQNEIEAGLKAYLNVTKVIWLPEGVYEDETDGHVDNLCCFVEPGVIALTWTDDVDDPQFAISQMAYDGLTNTVDARGRALQIHKIHQPTPMYITAEESAGIEVEAGSHPRPVGQRLAASYINYYVANGGVIMPFFDDPQDDIAKQTLQMLYPDRTIVGVAAREILLGGGNIHCITQQQPKASK